MKTAVRLRYRFDDILLQLETDIDEIRGFCRRFLAGLVEVDTDDSTGELHTYSASLLRSKNNLVAIESWIESCTVDVADALVHADLILRNWFALFAKSMPVLHGALVQSPDGNILISGPSGAGKSTLAIAARGLGWRVLGDEFVVVRFAAGKIVARALPRPIHLKISAPHSKLFWRGLAGFGHFGYAVRRPDGQLVNARYIHAHPFSAWCRLHLVVRLEDPLPEYLAKDRIAPRRQITDISENRLCRAVLLRRKSPEAMLTEIRDTMVSMRNAGKRKNTKVPTMKRRRLL